ncbi:MAG: DUF6767 domain-containing protein [Arachnia sp.]
MSSNDDDLHEATLPAAWVGARTRFGHVSESARAQRPAARSRRRPDAKCPLRPGEPCTLCQMSVTGPQDCPLVYLIMDDPEFREALAASKRR